MEISKCNRIRSRSALCRFQVQGNERRVLADCGGSATGLRYETSLTTRWHRVGWRSHKRAPTPGQHRENQVYWNGETNEWEIVLVQTRQRTDDQGQQRGGRNQSG